MRVRSFDFHRIIASKSSSLHAPGPILSYAWTSDLFALVTNARQRSDGSRARRTRDVRSIRFCHPMLQSDKERFHA
jgi:IS4 transposase